MEFTYKYYKVVPSPWFRGRYMVRVWRLWWPFWVEGIDGVSEELAAKWIHGDSVYYDGANQ